MVSSLDGSISVGGRSKGLSSEIDQQVFGIMRSLADVILVGSSTMKTENYGPANFNEDIKKQRATRGQLPLPPIAIVSKRADFDWTREFFSAASVKPIVFTTNKSAEMILEHRDKADIVPLGKNTVDAKKIKEHLASIGLRHILCEGGPTLNATLLEVGIVDELCLTVSPKIVQGAGMRIFNGTELRTPHNFSLSNIYIEEQQLFTRLKNES